jgi:hypothetical protein
VRLPAGQQVGGRADHRAQVHRGGVDRQVAGLQPGHHHQVVDEREHPLGVAADGGQGQRPFIRGEVVGVQALGERRDRGERGAQLVRDDGEEPRFERGGTYDGGWGS